MAEFVYYPDKEFLNQLNRLADESVADKVLNAGGSILATNLKREIRARVKHGTGATENSVRTSIKKDKDGNKVIYALPTGYDKKGKRNMDKLAYIEYGVRSANRAPQPFLVKLVKDSETEIMTAMQEVLNEVTK